MQQTQLPTLGAVQALSSQAQFAVYFANCALAGLDPRSDEYVTARQRIDAALLHIAEGKWRLGAVAGTHADFAVSTAPESDLQVAAAALSTAVSWTKGESNAEMPVPATRAGGEVAYFNDVPLVPSICPIVVLQGAAIDMGRQYARQVIEIYGPFVFEQQSAKRFTDAQMEHLKCWESELRASAPELIEFIRGWAEGATSAGIAMSYWQVLGYWTGESGPTSLESAGLGVGAKKVEASAAYSGLNEVFDSNPHDMCSGACAWGGATKDDGLYVGASTDHDCTFQATIVAYPEDGHAFIYTPFSVNGQIPVLGPTYLAGHPGMNAAGLAYVHHGGGSHALEDPALWDYGLRRGASTFHLLWNAADARQARDLELSWPIGDGLGVLGNPGGFYADAQGYAYILESCLVTPDHPFGIIREFTYDREGKAHHFLYATNNAISPLSKAGHFPPMGGYQYTLEGGWFIHDLSAIDSAFPVIKFNRWATKNSEGRNRFLYANLMARDGAIDAASMADIYRTSGTSPEGAYPELAERYMKGEQWDCSAAHRGNAFVGVMDVKQGYGGVYWACIGPANRFVKTRDPSHGYHYYDETGAFWRIVLAPTPLELMQDARATAEADIAHSDEALGFVMLGDKARGFYGAWAKDARESLAAGVSLGAAIDKAQGDDRLALIARAVRRFTRAQVRARQVIAALSPETAAL